MFSRNANYIPRDEEQLNYANEFTIIGIEAKIVDNAEEKVCKMEKYFIMMLQIGGVAVIPEKCQLVSQVVR